MRIQISKYFITKLQSKPEIVKFLIKEEISNILKRFSTIDKTLLTFLVGNGLDLNRVLMQAIETHDKKTIKLIIESGPDVNKADENGVTPLLAIIKRALLNSVNKTDGKIITLEDIKEIIELLIDKGADVNQASSQVNPIKPLEEAMKMTKSKTGFDYKQIIELLINEGATLTENVNKAAKKSHLTKFIDDCDKAKTLTAATKKREEKAKAKEQELLNKVEKIINTEPEPKKELSLASKYNANRNADDVMMQNPAPKDHIMQASVKEESKSEEVKEFSVSDFIDMNPEAFKDFSGEDANFDDLY
jgi:hypothetical protein